jgi:ATP synthase protein I
LSDDDRHSQGDESTEEITRKVDRRIRKRREGVPGAWFGLGMFGLIGWAVAVPTLIGIALGLWLDEVAPQPFSWTLALLLAGVVLGVINAWLWIERESPRE